MSSGRINHDQFVLSPLPRDSNGEWLLLLPLSIGCKKEEESLPTLSVCVCFRKWRVSEMCSNLTSMRQEIVAAAAAAKHKKDTQERKKEKRISLFQNRNGVESSRRV